MPALALALLSLLSVSACSATATEDGDDRPVPTATARTVDPPAGLAFPSVTGTNLQSEPVAVPDDFSGAPVLLLVGYVQDAQFDIDRWLLGLLQAETPVRCLELPAIPGWIPSLLSGRIDDGMRSGIPSEDWRSVVTVYGSEAQRVADFTGRERPLNARLLLLDADGRVLWFHDRGYSASLLLELDSLVRSLPASPEPDTDQRRT
jgi:ABC-type amino acid transport substrate-binding protein